VRLVFKGFTMKMLKRFVYKGFSPYYYARKTLYNLSNRTDYRRRKSYRASADPAAIEAIRAEGWTKPAMDLENVGKAVAYCRELEAKTWPQDTPPEAGQGKDFWTLIVNRSNVNEHPVLIEFASQPAFKNLASAYLGEEAVLSDIALMKSFPTHRQAKHSQLWHLDADDDRLLLFYVYCSDVDDGAGPFMLIPKSRQTPIYLPRFLRKYGYTDAEIKARSKPQSVVSVVGPAGTVFACDTATTYHCGSRCEDKTRLALSIRYTTRSGLYPVQPIAKAS